MSRLEGLAKAARDLVEAAAGVAEVAGVATAEAEAAKAMAVMAVMATAAAVAERRVAWPDSGEAMAAKRVAGHRYSSRGSRS